MLDCALLQILGDGGPRVGVVGFGELVGDAHVTAVGFPIVERGRNRVRDTDQVTGEVLYGAGWKRNRLVFDVRSSVARRPEATAVRSVWEGISGAGVISGDRLVGVVVADHLPAQHQGRRLEVVPIRAIIEAEGFSRAAESLGFAVRLDRVGARSRGRLEPAAVPPGTVNRPLLRQRIVRALASLDAAAVAVVGPPGFGKSTLALQACHHTLIAEGHPGGVCWLTLGNETDTAPVLARAFADLTGTIASAVTAEDLAQRIGDELNERVALLVLDDVWQRAPLDVVLSRVTRVPRLITTRNAGLVEGWADEIVTVDEPLLPPEAMAALAPAEALSESERTALSRLGERAGRWPLLVGLTSGHLRRLLRLGLPLLDAVARLEEQYQERGVIAFDAGRPEQRQQAVELTMSTSLDQLPNDDRRRCIAISVFHPQDAVPLEILSDTWELSSVAAEDLLLDLADQSLLRYDPTARTVVLHQVIRDFLELQLEDRPALHRRLVERWGNPLELTDRYRSTHLVWHLHQAGLTDRLFALVDDVAWYVAQRRWNQTGALYLSDLAQAWAYASEVNRASLERNGHIAPLLAREIRCALLTAGVRSRSGMIRSNLLVALVNANLRTSSDALAIVKQNPHARTRGYGLRALAPVLSEALVAQAVEAARDLEDPTEVSVTLAALTPFSPPGERVGMADEALAHARAADDPQAMASVADILPESTRHVVLQEAWILATAEDEPESRFQHLFSLLEKLSDDVGSRSETVLEAARTIDDPVQRASSLTDLLERSRLLSAQQRVFAISEAWSATDEIDETAERCRAVLSLADFAEERRWRDVLKAASDLLAQTDNAHDWASAIAALTKLDSRAPGGMDQARADIRNRARAHPDPAVTVVTLTSLANALTASEQDALMAEAFDMIDTVADRVTRANGLLWILPYVPDAFRSDVTQRLADAARAIETPADRALSLRHVSQYQSPPQQAALLREADEITPILDLEGVHDDDAFAEVAAAVASRVSAQPREFLVAEALRAAREIADGHDRGVALAAPLPYLTSTAQTKVATEIVAAAESAESGDEAAECLTAAAPYLHGDARESAFVSAIQHARRIDDTTAASARFTQTEPGIIETEKDWSPGGPDLRARLLAQLAALATPAERETLLRETLDAVYASHFQPDTIAAVAPELPATAVRELLESLRVSLHDPLRTRALIAILKRLAELESEQAAHTAAAAMWPGPVPPDVSVALAPNGHDTAAPNAADETRCAAPAQGSHGPNEGLTFEAQVKAPAFPSQLSKLHHPQQKIVSLALTFPPTLEPSRDDLDDLEQQVLENFLDQACADLPDDRIREVIDETAGFISGPRSTRAMAALIQRMIELGDRESAIDEAHVCWGDDPPARVFAALADQLDPEERRRIASRVLNSSWRIQEPVARADSLAALLPEMDHDDQTRAQDYIAATVRDRLKSERSDQAQAELIPMLSVLAPRPWLPLWQQALRTAAEGSRRRLLARLPGLIACAESFAADTLHFHDEIADSLIAVKTKWSTPT